MENRNKEMLKLEFKIREIKSKLRATDYQAIKYAEGELTAEEFAPIKEQRKAWRAEINALEEELERLREEQKEKEGATNETETQ